MSWTRKREGSGLFLTRKEVVPGLFLTFLLVVSDTLFCHIPLKSGDRTGVILELLLARGSLMVKNVALDAAQSPGCGKSENKVSFLPENRVDS